MLNIKMEHFRNLISLAGADGKIEETELSTLTKIANEQGIPHDRLTFMIKKANEYAYIIPQNTIEREKQMKDMISLAMVDGDFSKAEYDLIMKVGTKLGYSKKEAEQLIQNTINA